MATPPDFVSGQILTAAQLSAVGMWLVKTQTVAALSTEILLDSVFTSDYQNYKVEATFTSSGAVNMLVQFRTGTTNDASNTYTYENMSVEGVTVGAARATSTSWKPGDIYSTSDSNFLTATIFRPKEAARTLWNSQSLSALNGATLTFSAGQFANTTAFDGFRIYPSSGTFSATVRVYGIRN
jgi:hypothetical protein